MKCVFLLPSGSGHGGHGHEGGRGGPGQCERSQAVRCRRHRCIFCDLSPKKALLFGSHLPLPPSIISSSKSDLLAQAGRGRAHPGTTCWLRSESRRRGTFEKSWSGSAQVLVLALLVDLNQGNRKPKRTFSFRSEKERKYAPFRHKRVLSILTPQNRPFP